MEKRIYTYLSIITGITVLITSFVVVFLFLDYFQTDKTVFQLYLTILPAMVGIMVFLLVILFILSSKLTALILSPIKRAADSIESILSGEKIEYSVDYPEIRPFIQTIDRQKRQIDIALTELREAEKIRRDFTANVSHELKTPLTSINGFAEMISTGITKEEETKKFATIIHKEGSRLLELIDSIISLSQLEDSKSEKINESIDLLPLSNKIIEQLEIRAKERGVTLKLNCEHIVIRANKRMIEDMLFNLLDNGIKYNKDSGSVTLTIVSDDYFAKIIVADTGIGIPDEDQKRIFERFYRVDKSRSKKVSGSGLGLSIVKHIVDYHGGTMELWSEENIGTKITISLPL